MPENQPFPKVVDLIPVAKSMGQEAFRQYLGSQLLVGPAPTAEGNAGGWSYLTDSRRAFREPTTSLVLMETDVVISLRKAPGRPFADTLLIGRAASNDVCLDHATISKLHARIQFSPNGELHLSDAGSRNGTTVAGRRLNKGETVLLTQGASVGFGVCRFQFLDAHLLQSMLLTIKT